MELDPALIVTPPRSPKTAAEIRKRLDEEGIPEAPMARVASLPLSAARLAALGLNVPRADWAVVAPSHALASQFARPRREGRADRAGDAARRICLGNGLEFEPGWSAIVSAGFRRRSHTDCNGLRTERSGVALEQHYRGDWHVARRTPAQARNHGESPDRHWLRDVESLQWGRP